MSYPFGERIEGVMKIAEVTTDTETGFLAFNAVMITGEAIETDTESRETCHTMEMEPVELCYVSHRTGEMTPVWKYDPNVIEVARRESKERAINSFLECRGADIIDIEDRTERFRSNMLYTIEPEEMDCIVGRELKDYRRSGTMESAKDILSKSDIFRQILGQKRTEQYGNSRHLQQFRGRARWN
jgi:hypothetical protein